MKKGKKIFLIILAVIIVVGLIGALGGGDDEPEPEDITYTDVTVATLEKDLDANSLNATEKYKDQYLRVSGYLSTIDAQGEYISMDAGDEDYSLTLLTFNITDDEQLDTVKNMKTGDKLTIEAKCTDVGEVFGYTFDIKDIL